MKAHQGIALIMSLALLPLEMRAQFSEPQPSVVGPLEAPVTLNGQRPAAAFKSEKMRGSYLSGGIGLTGMVTDNSFLSTTDGVSNIAYLLQPYVNVAQTRSRLNWQAGFGAALMVNQQISEENQAAEDLNLDLSYRLAPYVNLRLSSDFSNATGFFSSLKSVTSASSIGLLEEASDPLLVPFTQRTISTSNLAELNYQFGLHSITGARATYSSLNYPGVSNNMQFGSLLNSRTYSAEAFYNYQISAKQWVGAMLRTQKFEIQPSLGNTEADSGFFLYALSVTPNVTLSLFAGPEWFEAPRVSEVATIAKITRGWTPSGGATFIWKEGHTSVLAEFARKLNDGEGLSSAATFQAADAELRRQLSGHQEVSFGFTYQKYDPLEPGQGARFFVGQFQFQQRLARSLIALIGYTRERQEYHGLATANILWLSMSYDFLHTFGR